MSGRGVLLVGGNSDIALAIARQFVDGGDRVVGVGLTPSEDAAYASFLVGDCADAQTATSVVDQAIRLLGRLDVLVLAAAVMPVAAAATTTDEQWHGALAATPSSPRLPALVAYPARSDPRPSDAVASPSILTTPNARSIVVWWRSTPTPYRHPTTSRCVHQA